MQTRFLLVLLTTALVLAAGAALGTAKSKTFTCKGTGKPEGDVKLIDFDDEEGDVIIGSMDKCSLMWVSSQSNPTWRKARSVILRGPFKGGYSATYAVTIAGVKLKPSTSADASGSHGAGILWEANAATAIEFFNLDLSQVEVEYSQLTSVNHSAALLRIESALLHESQCSIQIKKSSLTVTAPSSAYQAQMRTMGLVHIIGGSDGRTYTKITMQESTLTVTATLDNILVAFLVVGGYDSEQHDHALAIANEEIIDISRCTATVTVTLRQQAHHQITPVVSAVAIVPGNLPLSGVFDDAPNTTIVHLRTVDVVSCSISASIGALAGETLQVGELLPYSFHISLFFISRRVVYRRKPEGYPVQVADINIGTSSQGRGSGGGGGGQSNNNNAVVPPNEVALALHGMQRKKLNYSAYFFDCMGVAIKLKLTVDRSFGNLALESNSDVSQDAGTPSAIAGAARFAGGTVNVSSQVFVSNSLVSVSRLHIAANLGLDLFLLSPVGGITSRSQQGSISGGRAAIVMPDAAGLQVTVSNSSIVIKKEESSSSSNTGAFRVSLVQFEDGKLPSGGTVTISGGSGIDLPGGLESTATSKFATLRCRIAIVDASSFWRSQRGPAAEFPVANYVSITDSHIRTGPVTLADQPLEIAAYMQYEVLLQNAIIIGTAVAVEQLSSSSNSVRVNLATLFQVNISSHVSFSSSNVTVGKTCTGKKPSVYVGILFFIAFRGGMPLWVSLSSCKILGVGPVGLGTASCPNNENDVKVVLFGTLLGTLTPLPGAVGLAAAPHLSVQSCSMNNVEITPALRSGVAPQVALVDISGGHRLFGKDTALSANGTTFSIQGNSISGVTMRSDDGSVPSGLALNVLRVKGAAIFDRLYVTGNKISHKTLLPGASISIAYFAKSVRAKGYSSFLRNSIEVSPGLQGAKPEANTALAGIFVVSFGESVIFDKPSPAQGAGMKIIAVQSNSISITDVQERNVAGAIFYVRGNLTIADGGTFYSLKDSLRGSGWKITDATLPDAGTSRLHVLRVDGHFNAQSLYLYQDSIVLALSAQTAVSGKSFAVSHAVIYGAQITPGGAYLTQNTINITSSAPANAAAAAAASRILQPLNLDAAILQATFNLTATTPTTTTTFARRSFSFVSNNIFVYDLQVSGGRESPSSFSLRIFTTSSAAWNLDRIYYMTVQSCNILMDPATVYLPPSSHSFAAVMVEFKAPLSALPQRSFSISSCKLELVGRFNSVALLSASKVADGSTGLRTGTMDISTSSINVMPSLIAPQDTTSSAKAVPTTVNVAILQTLDDFSVSVLRGDAFIRQCSVSVKLDAAVDENCVVSVAGAVSSGAAANVTLRRLQLSGVDVKLLCGSAKLCSAALAMMTAGGSFVGSVMASTSSVRVGPSSLLSSSPSTTQCSSATGITFSRSSSVDATSIGIVDSTIQLLRGSASLAEGPLKNLGPCASQAVAVSIAAPDTAALTLDYVAVLRVRIVAEAVITPVLPLVAVAVRILAKSVLPRPVGGGSGPQFNVDSVRIAASSSSVPSSDGVPENLQLKGNYFSQAGALFFRMAEEGGMPVAVIFTVLNCTASLATAERGRTVQAGAVVFMGNSLNPGAGFVVPVNASSIMVKNFLLHVSSNGSAVVVATAVTVLPPYELRLWQSQEEEEEEKEEDGLLGHKTVINVSGVDIDIAESAAAPKPKQMLPEAVPFSATVLRLALPPGHPVTLRHCAVSATAQAAPGSSAAAASASIMQMLGCLRDSTPAPALRCSDITVESSSVSSSLYAALILLGNSNPSFFNSFKIRQRLDRRNTTYLLRNSTSSGLLLAASPGVAARPAFNSANTGGGHEKEKSSSVVDAWWNQVRGGVYAPTPPLLSLSAAAPPVDRFLTMPRWIIGCNDIGPKSLYAFLELAKEREANASYICPVPILLSLSRTHRTGSRSDSELTESSSHAASATDNGTASQEPTATPSLSRPLTRSHYTESLSRSGGGGAGGAGAGGAGTRSETGTDRTASKSVFVSPRFEIGESAAAAAVASVSSVAGTLFAMPGEAAVAARSLAILSLARGCPSPQIDESQRKDYSEEEFLKRKKKEEEQQSGSTGSSGSSSSSSGGGGGGKKRLIKRVKRQAATLNTNDGNDAGTTTAAATSSSSSSGKDTEFVWVSAWIVDPLPFPMSLPGFFIGDPDNGGHLVGAILLWGLFFVGAILFGLFLGHRHAAARTDAAECRFRETGTRPRDLDATTLETAPVLDYYTRSIGATLGNWGSLAGVALAVGSQRYGHIVLAGALFLVIPIVAAICACVFYIAWMIRDEPGRPLVVRSALFFPKEPDGRLAAWARQFLVGKRGRFWLTGNYRWIAPSATKFPDPSLVVPPKGPVAHLGKLIGYFGPRLRKSGEVDQQCLLRCTIYYGCWVLVVNLLAVVIAGAAQQHTQFCTAARAIVFTLSFLSLLVTVLLRPHLIAGKLCIAFINDLFGFVVGVCSLPGVLSDKQLDSFEEVCALVILGILGLAMLRKGIKSLLQRMAGPHSKISRSALVAYNQQLEARKRGADDGDDHDGGEEPIVVQRDGELKHTMRQQEDVGDVDDDEDAPPRRINSTSSNHQREDEEALLSSSQISSPALLMSPTGEEGNNTLLVSPRRQQKRGTSNNNNNNNDKNETASGRVDVELTSSPRFSSSASSPRARANSAALVPPAARQRSNSVNEQQQQQQQQQVRRQQFYSPILNPRPLQPPSAASGGASSSSSALGRLNRYYSEAEADDLVLLGIARPATIVPASSSSSRSRSRSNTISSGWTTSGQRRGGSVVVNESNNNNNNNKNNSAPKKKNGAEVVASVRQRLQQKRDSAASPARQPGRRGDEDEREYLGINDDE